MKRKQKPMKITQLDTIKGVRHSMPQPTVRHKVKNKGVRFNTKQALLEYYDDQDDELQYFLGHFDDGDLV